MGGFLGHRGPLRRGRRVKGTYILELEIDHPVTLQVGAIGTWPFGPGLYLYVGSALGPGGLPARLARHFRREKTRRWHLDYLAAHGEVLGTHVKEDGVRHECEWARWLACRAVGPMPGFGASDCSCATHLFFVDGRPALSELMAEAERELGLEVWSDP